MANLPVMKSPGVYVREIDLSQYSAIMSSLKIFGIVTVAQNGPIDKIVEISNVREFINTFGNPISAGGIACVRYLVNAGNLKVVRTAGNSAAARTTTLAGVDSEDQAVTNALVISHKYKGTLYSDAIKVTVSAISGATVDKFNLKITKGDDDTELVNGNYTIVKANATSEYPYIIDESDTDFVFTLGTDTTLKSLTAVTNQALTVGDNGTELTNEQITNSINVFNDAENIDLDVIAAPGMYSAAALTALITCATDRKDTLAILDPPQGLTPEEVVQFANGLNVQYGMSKIDSTYAAMWYPWGKVYNEYTSAYEWMPPSVGIIAGMGLEYQTYDVWTAPAGIPRMQVNVYSEMERVLSKKDRDILYPEHINPICNYKGLGMTAFGQKTMQRALTATDRINVRFLVNYVKKVADYSTALFLFSNIDENTFSSWTQVIDKELANIKNRGGMYDYKITMDWTTVTDECLNNNIMPGVIQIKPTKSAEFIPIDVVIRNRSDEFDT